jgi:hypothetical protein
VSGMDPKLCSDAIDVIAAGDGKRALDLLTRIIGSAAGAPSEPDPDEVESAIAADDPNGGDAAGSEGNGAEGVPEPAKAKKNGNQSPRIDAAAVQRGRRALGWPCK